MLGTESADDEVDVVEGRPFQADDGGNERAAVKGQIAPVVRRGDALQDAFEEEAAHELLRVPGLAFGRQAV